MIFGIGIDIIEVERIEKLISKSSKTFIHKLFTEKEIAYCESKLRNKAQNYAARFAVKEAFLKAYGTGLRHGLNWKEIETENDELGKPMIVLYGNIKKLVAQKGIAAIRVTLSHIKDIAVAVVILEK